MSKWILIFGLIQLFHSSLSAANEAVFAVQNGEVVGKPAELYCNFGITNNTSIELYWLKGANLVSFGSTVVNNYKGRLQFLDGETWESNFKLDPVTYLDTGSYTCQNTEGKKKTFDLYVNKIPDVSVEVIQKTVKEGETVSVGSCSALKSLPESRIWFEDQDGNEVESLNLTESKNDSTLIDTWRILSLEWSRAMHGNKYTCVVEHPDVDVPIRKPLIDAINVQYAPSIGMEENSVRLVNGKSVVRQENDELQVTCRAQGNPIPKVTWTYLSDSPPENETVTGKLPRNFIAEKRNGEGEETLTSNSLQPSGLNNGTFVCTAESEVFSSISTSFNLFVYDTPTTPAPPPTTTQEDITEETTNIVEATVTPEMSYKTGGMSPVIIAILVAAICFVCIIVVIGVVRYFMTHKGEYYTNELKTAQSDPDIEDDDMDDNGGMTEAELLGSRKTEHFV